MLEIAEIRNDNEIHECPPHNMTTGGGGVRYCTKCGSTAEEIEKEERKKKKDKK